MAHGHRIGSGAMENGARYPGNRQREKGIDPAISETQSQAQDETYLVRLDVTVEPPIQNWGLHVTFPRSDCFFLAAFCATHEIRAAACCDSRESIALITASVEI